jgi:hypothetical protein
MIQYGMSYSQVMKVVCGPFIAVVGCALAGIIVWVVFMLL